METWSLLHETGHSLQEGIHSVFVKGGLSTETDEACHLLANCLLRITPDYITPVIEDLTKKAVSLFRTNVYETGVVMSDIAMLACEGDVLPKPYYK